MRTDYIRELRENYLRIICDQEADYGMKMLIGHPISRFLRITERKINGESQFMYKISSLMSMEDIYVGKGMSAKELEGIMKSLLELFDVLDNYLMDSNRVVLKPEFIFRDAKDEGWYFVYSPESSNDFTENLKSLFEYIIKVVNHKDSKAVTMAYGVYKRLSEENVNPKKLFEFETKDSDEGEIIKEKQVIETVIPETVIEEIEEKDYTKIYMAYGIVFVYGILALYSILGIFIKAFRIKNIGSGIYVVFLIVQAVVGYLAYGWYQRNKGLFVKITKRQADVPFEKENIRVILPKEVNKEDDATVFLDEEVVKSTHYLKWCENMKEKTFSVSSSAILIGSAWDKVDCVISERGVSRIHARITTEGKSFYIKDMNSTNGTKVNGKELACYELCEIKPMDRIEFGNLECTFV